MSGGPVAAEAAALLDRLELELHHLPAHDVAQIVLPKLPETPGVVHQELEAQPAPERQQSHVNLYFPESRRAVVANSYCSVEMDWRVSVSQECAVA